MHAELLTKLKALGEPTRLRIVTLLLRGELTVSEIMQVLGQSQPRVSRHLKLLADAGLCERYPEGGWVFYRLARSRVGERLAALLEEMARSDDPEIARDLVRLNEVRRLRAQTAQKYFEVAAEQWAKIRGLHFSEEAVEAAMLEAAGDRRFRLHLDVGTGTGRMLEIFAERAEDGMGVDLSREMLTVARSKMSEAGLVNRLVRQADATALPLEPGAADLITVHQVLHYLDAPERAIAEWARVLAEGGLLLLADFETHGFEEFASEYHHAHLGFGRAELKSWLEAAGLTVRSLEPLVPAKQEDGLTVLICVAEKPTGKPS
ncbi:MAG: metalloregulator ArsR/SmtB family transcription factor [Oceanicaulis sp.]|uniref:ArsR/SmtB family transcription factor n=1 Tax=Glycocaulis sp. TaxID=1969725 RepID=UPI0025C4E18D|nr:metalloregulator ArsR/SmtB family transcription factor [Glycocaulis sp.]MCC5981754.1 metalloregulator ArsR/SmtB family transcription factor [Oceanicaulis sp.]MCH8520472.1 metalloregulator ArsR/SmtB family transcription factor [Glycocaulis sp.]